MKFTTIKSEGGLIPYDILEKIYSADIIGQSAKDFGLVGGSVLDEISKSWKAARTFYGAFQLRLNRLKPEDSTIRDTREQWIIPLLESLGFPKVTYFAKADEIEGKTYAISHRANDTRESLPIHIVGIKDNLDKRAESGRPRLSPHSLMQEFLNHTEHLWGIVSNGYSLRLLRDSSKISRPVFIEFDLQQILEQEKFNEFALLFRLIHYSRLPKHKDDSSDCFIEKYYNEAINTGGRVRDKLRDGVEEALKILGNGFIIHPENKWLYEAILQKDINAIEFYRQLLRLVYRLLFLMVSEERNLVGPSDPKKEPIYYNFYSINRLRELSHTFIPGISKPSDQWESLLVTFKLYTDEGYGDKLSISALNGDLFGQNAIPFFEKCKLFNKDLLNAIKGISRYDDNGNKRRINYLALDVEELGSVYESLLDFHPVFQISNINNIQFQLVFGSERKTTGSYYTNHDLVQELIKSALVPIIKNITDKKISVEDKIKELLRLKVCDPAAGSGHFLLAAARRIAEEVAKLRSGEDYPAPTEYNIAKRDVIQRCIYGVDLNPLAVDLCKLALWLEGHTKGKPLSFLDHRIRNGNSLIGAYSFEQIKKGIPDSAFNPVTGDNKEVAQYFKKRNKDERKGQLNLFASSMVNDITSLSKSFSHFDDLNIDTTDDYHKAEEEFRKLLDNPQWKREWHVANIWQYSFFAPLTDIDDRNVPTYEQLLQYLSTPNSPNARLIGKADAASLKNKYFHWFLIYPEVFLNGGFDCILGNPPWERIKLQEKEFFASRSLEIANAPTASIRKNLIESLRQQNPELFKEFEDSKRHSECESKFIRQSERYPFTAKGDINTYAIFSELARTIINDHGRVGIIVPTGIATDDTTKEFFADLVNKEAIVSLFDYENKEGLFANVHRSFKFSLLTLTGIKAKNKSADFAFFLTNIEQVKEEDRHFTLTREELAILNPNTKNCPLFRSKKDAELTKKIYKKLTALYHEKNVWGVRLFNILHMANDSNRFSAQFIEGAKPLYEAKMFHQFDHAFSTFKGVLEDDIRKGQSRYFSNEEKCDKNEFIIPRYWINEFDFNSFFQNSNWKNKWLIAFRGVTSTTNERSMVCSIIPLYPNGHTITNLILEQKYKDKANCLVANFNSFCFDYVLRQKMGGTYLGNFVFYQLPIISYDTFCQEDTSFINHRVLELTFYKSDLSDYAKDYGYEGPPFTWNEERRFLIRCELDALYFKLYGMNREEVDYIMETFPIVKRRDIEKFNNYRTKLVLLEIFDDMLECDRTGRIYQTRLDPPPADSSVAHKI